jgi:tetratricopeptide repeat protein 30
VQVVGFDAHLSYNIALCYYRLRDFAPALKHIADIIERGIRDHPELSVGMQTEGIEVIRTSHKLSSFNVCLTRKSFL